jgi:hypothetical protein
MATLRITCWYVIWVVMISFCIETCGNYCGVKKIGARIVFIWRGNVDVGDLSTAYVIA